MERDALRKHLMAFAFEEIVGGLKCGHNVLQFPFSP
jgi:hypothetical protein